MKDQVNALASHTIGIVGGGQGGTGLLKFLLGIGGAKVLFVVDRSDEAPGTILAREKAIPTYTDLTEAIQKTHCTLIFEMTGVQAVQDQLVELAKVSGAHVMPSNTWLLVMAMEGIKEQTEHRIAHQIKEVKTSLENDLNASQKLVGEINHVMSTMQMLALNAGIEAAKAGTMGRGFSVVADHMTKSVENVRHLTQEIVVLNENIGDSSMLLDNAIASLC